MSADNWGVCPKCRAVKQAARISLKKRLESDYGVVSLSVYKQLEAEYEKTEGEGDDNYTLREDYEFWLNEDGAFYADYCGSCAECGFQFTFRHEEEVTL